MFQFLKRHIIKATYSLRRGGRHYHFGVVFQVGGESERAIFVFFTAPPKGHRDMQCDGGALSPGRPNARPAPETDSVQ
jgi:hypothetical protein